MTSPGHLWYTPVNADKILCLENNMLSRLFVNFIIEIGAFIFALIFDFNLANRELRKA